MWYDKVYIIEGLELEFYSKIIYYCVLVTYYKELEV